MNDREEFSKALDNFIRTVGEELGMYKILDWLVKVLEKRDGRRL